MQPRILLPLAAAAMVLAVPAAANAAVTSTVNVNTLTIASDAAADNIALTVTADGKLAVNGTAQTLNSDGSATVIVNAGGGNDTIALSAPGLPAPNLDGAQINGDDGDDIITGS